MSTAMFTPSTAPPQNPVQISKVIHIRNVTPDITEHVLRATLEPFGHVDRVLVLKGKKQALVQFESINSALNFMGQCAKATFKIGQTIIHPQFSTHSSIEASSSPSSGTNPSRILLVSIANAVYAVNVSVLFQVFSQFDASPSKGIEKIVIFRKTAGTQALIQFTSVETAARAKTELDGKNIYSGCCSLSIAYSNLPDLIVKQQSDLTRDFTRTDLPERPAELGPRVLPTTTGAPGLIGAAGAPLPGIPGMVELGKGCVLLVSGFPPGRIGCNELFNLFSNYGKIVRIKVLHNKQHMAFVQFADPDHAHNAMTHLRYAKIFGGHLQLNYSHHASINPASRRTPPGAAESGEGGEQRTVEYETSTLNRFDRYGATNPKNLSSPTDTLHISNIAARTTAETISQVMTRAGPVMHVKVYDKDGKMMALVQFQSVETAVEAMCLLHNTLVDGLHIRLAFTKNKI